MRFIWREEMKGKNAQGLTEQEFLGRYDPQKYEHPSVTVDVLIFTVDKSREAYSLRILLERREEHPFLHKWALPGSFVGMGESVEQAAARELEEETGYVAGNLELLLTLRTTVAFCNEKIDVYLATDLKPGSQHLDEDEFLNAESHDLDELVQMIYDCKIQDGKTVSAILAYKAKYGK